jgi:tetratricopeptide (TPR) repeat protein
MAETARVSIANASKVASTHTAAMDVPREQSVPVMEPRYLVRPDEFLIWIALGGVLVVSLSAMVFCWQMSRRNHAVTSPPPRAETPGLIAPTLLPVISQAIKESLVQELSAQRRELLSAQQSAAAELSQLARRLEAVQTPLLERLNGLRPSVLPPAKFSREIPVKVFCGCGQKYAFEVQPVDGHMPFPVACPACGRDGTHQANQVIVRLLNGITQPLSPNGDLFLNAAPTGITPQLVEAVKQAVVNELAAKRAENPKPIPVAIVPEYKNGSSVPVEKPVGNVLPKLLAEGQSLADAGELDKAVKCLEAALALQPDRAETFVKLAGVFEKLDRADEALQHYDRAIALDESLTIAYLNKGGVFNRLARYDEALRCYEQALLKQKKTAA